MDIGIALPHMNETTPTLLTRVAQQAEQLGYASLWVGERLLRPREYRPFGFPPGPMPDYFKDVYDPLLTLSFVAGQTKTIKLGTSVVVSHFHEPLVLARHFATLDQLSQGRVIAGLGQGWLRDEFEATNAVFQERGKRLEDYVRAIAIRAVWGPDPVRHEGPYYRIGESDIGPKPLQPGGPPLLFGVGERRALERAARLSDGINPHRALLEAAHLDHAGISRNGTTGRAGSAAHAHCAPLKLSDQSDPSPRTTQPAERLCGTASRGCAET